jgi:hypothetical protein
MAPGTSSARQQNSDCHTPQPNTVPENTQAATIQLFEAANEVVKRRNLIGSDPSVDVDFPQGTETGLGDTLKQPVLCE